MIGYLGSIVFTVSAENVKTFDSMQRSGSVRWSEHAIHGKKPVLEFVGPNADSLRFTMRLDVALGVNPIEEIKEMRQLMNDGEVLPLVLAEKYVSDFAIESIDDSWLHVDNRGNILVADISVSLKEYPNA